MYRLTADDLEILKIASDYLRNVSLNYCHPAHPDVAEWNGVHGVGVALQELVEKYSEEVSE